ncbi:hypothetical protein ACOSP7_018797 [Xanthoceras sorbifolium]
MRALVPFGGRSRKWSESDDREGFSGGGAFFGSGGEFTNARTRVDSEEVQVRADRANLTVGSQGNISLEKNSAPSSFKGEIPSFCCGVSLPPSVCLFNSDIGNMDLSFKLDLLGETSVSKVLNGDCLSAM